MQVVVIFVIKWCMTYTPSKSLKFSLNGHKTQLVKENMTLTPKKSSLIEVP